MVQTVLSEKRIRIGHDYETLEIYAVTDKQRCIQIYKYITKAVELQR